MDQTMQYLNESTCLPTLIPGLHWYYYRPIKSKIASFVLTILVFVGGRNLYNPKCIHCTFLCLPRSAFP